MRDIKFRATGERKRVVDVLAFAEPAAFPHPEVKNGIIGEVYINGERCRGDREQVIALLVHGILHLLNFCHDSKRDTIRMKRMEQRILRLFR
jgi:ssRNA-specific RNase YbeY (16S rRNA maturation enzyme)